MSRGCPYGRVVLSRWSATRRKRPPESRVPVLMPSLDGKRPVRRLSRVLLMAGIREQNWSPGETHWWRRSDIEAAAGFELRAVLPKVQKRPAEVVRGRFVSLAAWWYHRVYESRTNCEPIGSDIR